MPEPTTSPLDNSLIKVRVGIGPITLDVEDNPDKLTLLVTKIVESFMGRKIIDVTAVDSVTQEFKSKVAPQKEST